MHRHLVCAALDHADELLHAIRRTPCERWVATVDMFIARLTSLSLSSPDLVLTLLAPLADQVAALGDQRENDPRRRWRVTASTTPSASELLASFRSYVVAVVGNMHDVQEDRIEAVKRFIDEHYAETVTTARLAAAVGLERTYLATIFKRRTGETLHRYLTRVRIARATSLIRRGVKIEAAILSVGYASKGNFYRLIRASTGVTPAALRRDGAPAPRAELTPE